MGPLQAVPAPDKSRGAQEETTGRGPARHVVGPEQRESAAGSACFRPFIWNRQVVMWKAACQQGLCPVRCLHILNPGVGGDSLPALGSPGGGGMLGTAGWMAWVASAPGATLELAFPPALCPSLVLRSPSSHCPQEQEGDDSDLPVWGLGGPCGGGRERDLGVGPCSGEGLGAALVPAGCPQSL